MVDVGGGRGWVFRESISVSKQLASMQQDICIYMYIYRYIDRCIYIYVYRYIGTHKFKYAKRRKRSFVLSLFIFKETPTFEGPDLTP